MKKPNEQGRESGMSLVEVTISSTIMAVVLFQAGITLTAGMRRQGESTESYRVFLEVKNLVAQVQDQANSSQGFGNVSGIASVYNAYHQQTFTTDSGAVIGTVCYANEAAVPDIFGGPQDLNHDGDNEDNLGNASLGTDLKLVPMELQVRYQVDGRDHSMTVYRLFARTAN